MKLVCFSCSLGYYGDPRTQGSRCQPCGCSGNLDLSVPGSCDGLTGACLICGNNTTGSQCERCDDWWFGDAIVRKDCRRRLIWCLKLSACVHIGILYGFKEQISVRYIYFTFFSQFWKPLENNWYSWSNLCCYVLWFIRLTFNWINNPVH